MSDQFSLDPTRRQLLASFGAGGVFAGGIPGFRAVADGFTPMAGQSPRRGTLVGAMSGPTQGLHFNLFEGSSASLTAEMVFDPTVKYHRGRGEFIPAAVTEWAVESETMTLSLRPDLVWDDGDPVTAQDLRTQLLLGKTVDDDLWEYATGIETLGEKRLAIRFEEAYNPALLERVVLGDRRLFVKHEYYESFLETLRAEGKDAAETALGEFKPSSMSEFAASGPFTVDSIDFEGVELELNTTYPDADSIGFQSYRFRAFNETARIFQALEAGDIDVIAGTTTLPNQSIELPSSVHQVQIPDYWGFGLWPNQDVEPLNDRAVRQAIAFVVDRSAVSQASGRETNQPVDTPSGLPATAVEDWIDETMLETYVDPENEAAADVLSEAGYTREGETWRAEDGTPLGFSVSVPEFWTDWVNATEAVVDQLVSFGIEADVRKVGMQQIFAGDFAITAGWWLPNGLECTHPYVAYRFGFGMEMSQPDLIEYSGMDRTVRVSGDDGPVNVTPQAELQALSTTVDRDKAESIVQRLAKVYNVDLPMLPLYQRYNTSFLNTDNVDAPPAGSPKFQIAWPPHWLVRTGDLHSPGWSENRTPTSTETETNISTATVTETNTSTGTETETNTPTTTEPETTQPTQTETETSPSTPTETATETKTPAATTTDAKTPIATDTEARTPTATDTQTKTPTATDAQTKTPTATDTDRSTTESRTTTVSGTADSTTSAGSENGENTEDSTDGATTTDGPGFGLLSSVAGVSSYALYQTMKRE